MAKTFDFDLGVIGGGAAGLTVTSGAAQLGAKTLLVEKAPALGGDCLHYGCVPSKTLIKSARVYNQMRHLETWGLPSVEAPPVCFSKVADRIRAVIASIQEHDSVDRFCGLGAAVKFGDPEFMDEHTIMLDGKRHTAARWVIATGSEASTPPVPGLKETGYITNREVFSLEELPGHLVVLGGGPIALEMAQAFRRLGSEVTVIQRSNHLLTREDADMADIVRGQLEHEGVKVYAGTSISKIEAKNGKKCVHLTWNEEEHTICGDMILAALGRTPNVDGLALENAGVEFGKRGIPVDNRMRTNQKNIFACGDITGAYQFTHAAGYEGGIVLTNAVLRLPRKADYTWMPWCTYTEPELGGLGMTEKQAIEQGIEYRAWTEYFKGNDRAKAEAETLGKVKLLLDAKERPIGVQMAGAHAGDLLATWVATLSGKVKLSALAGAVFPYPTFGEINKRVAGDVFAPKLFSDKVRKGLAFIFHYKGRACGLEDSKENV